ncbi:MAG: M28 family peptidase, partial [Saprospiraceae bacterium]|nr:M28 family peptidase [Saprospiraceae bacterium]
MKLHLFCTIWLFFTIILAIPVSSQTNIISTSTQAAQILLGNYDPAEYAPASPTPVYPEVLAAELKAAISPDSLKAFILQLAAFRTRNSGSDTVSETEGIGAARRWAFRKFSEYSAANGNRLIPSYLQFDLAICNVGQHKNIFAVLPGSVPGSGVVLVEGHMDSRCHLLCDVTCVAEGVEDNATGTALVLEMARVMARYQFENTVVFMITTAEEQGLLGADAFADYVFNNNIPLRAVLNNDVIGGILCGETSSPPSCPGLDHVDSTSVRLFSFGSANSKHKQLARFIKLQYRENLLPFAEIPMNVRIMSPEDRTGRGGDHIPFRQKGYPAMRFTSANEHGDASNGTGYTDRQHTSDDVLGADTNGDGAVDSFFVDFNYLARNTLINANALAIAAR